MFYFVASEARADHVVITGGSATQLIDHHFDLLGAGFRVNGGGDFGFSPCHPCQAGDPISLFDYFAGESSLNRGPATINGTDYPQLYYTGAITFSTATLVIPPDDSSLVTLTTPFTLDGYLDGYLTNPFVATGPKVFSVTVSGQGIATLQLSSALDPTYGRLYFFRGTTYNFQPAEVPEPATLLLLGTGLTGIIAAVRRRRRSP